MNRIFAGIFLLLHVVCFPARAAEPGHIATRVTVFKSGQDSYACYRIPAMVTTRNGTIIAMADGRIRNCADIPNPLDLVIKRSFDQGCTWGPLQIVAPYGSDTNTADVDVYPFYGITNPVQRVGAGDAALLLDQSNGRIWTLYDNAAYVRGLPNQRALKLELRYSDDDGATWSGPVDIEKLNPGLRPSNGQFLSSPGNGIQLEEGPHAGRLIFPTYVYKGSNFCTLIYSDNHGQSWRRGGNAGLGGGEIQIAETTNGALLASIRNSGLGRGVRWFNRSQDGGETWGQPYSSTAEQAAIPDPTCQASLLRLGGAPGPEVRVWIHANAASPSARSNMTVRVSYDTGRTWSTSKQVYAGSSAYSALTQLANGKAGLLFEADNYTRIDFVPQMPLFKREGKKLRER